MKKLLLLIIVGNLIASPSFALKLITNEETDRTVPSRSSLYDSSMTDDEYEIYKMEQEREYKKAYNNYKDYDNIGWMYDSSRSEVVGGRWLYPKLHNDLQNENVNLNYKKAKKSNSKYSKKTKGYIREAADYYTINVVK